MNFLSNYDVSKDYCDDSKIMYLIMEGLVRAKVGTGQQTAFNFRWILVDLRGQGTDSEI